MYRKHKVMLVLITICCGIISFMFKVSYSIIASDGITVNSIVLAIYMTSFSGLVSSDLAKKMQRKEDKILNGKSQFVEKSNLLVLNKLERLLTVCKVKNIDDIDFRCFKPKENYTRRNY